MMKCTNCGKNIATYHYRSSVNGQVTEQHLCQECAQRLRGEENVFSGFDSMFDNFFSGFGDFFGRSPFFGGFDSFAMPTMVMPRIQFVLQGADASQKVAEPETQEKADPELSKRRELNALREQMKAAAEAEDYEKAAQIRDKLRELEKKE
jgi:protein arginine kinase activator